MRGFETGDVCFIFGDLDVVVAQKFYLCDACGYKAVTSGNIPAASVLYISEDHRTKSIAWLREDEDLRARIQEGFAIIDRIHNHMARIAAQYGELSVKDAKEQKPS